MADDAWAIWRAAAQRESVDAALRAFYADLDAAVAQGDAVCDQSGRCCRFDSFGHRLYVTALEIAWFLKEVSSFEFPVSSSKAEHRGTDVALPQLETRNSKLETDACPYQVAGRCSQHTIRPMGCRIFFCQRGTETWQHDLYETYLARLKALHAGFDVPYRYLEWRAGLIEAEAECRTI